MSPKCRASGISALLLSLIIFNLSINYASCEINDKQVVVFMADGLLSRLTSGSSMPLLHSFVNHGVWDIKVRGDVSYSSPKIGWLSSLFGVTPAQLGCDVMTGCGVLPPEIENAYNIFDVLTDTLSYHDNIYSEDPEYTTNVIGNVYSVRKFTSRVGKSHELADDLSALTPAGDRLVVFHFKELVTTGFSDGWASSNYVGQVACLDYQIHQLTMDLWEYSPNRTTFILLSDRGGYGFSNQNFYLDTSQIVFAAWGYGVKQPPNIQHISINPTQIAKTILAMVDDDYETDVPSYWNAEQVDECLQPDPAHHLTLDTVTTPTNPPAPLCIIPNTVPNTTIKVICGLSFGILVIFALAISNMRWYLFS